jgi:DNA primase
VSIRNTSLEEIKSRVDIEEVVSDFVSLKRKGQNLWACCPFHDEKTPSFSVSPTKGIFKCFGCGKAGDAIEFIKEIEGLNYIQAMRYLGKKYGIELDEEEETPEDIAKQSFRESLFIILGYAKDYFHDQLLNQKEGQTIGLSYFKERGYNQQIIKDFELGYSLDQWDGLLKEALSKGFQKQTLIASGMVIQKEEKIYDRFRGRVIFPIHNITGKVIAFGARTLKSDKGAKYINSPETEVYQKSKVLYGLHQGSNSIRQQDNCYLVEGYTDVISLHLSGVPNVVASSGTSLTDDQIRLIKRYTNNITVLFDGDPAGIKASLRGIDMLLESGANVRVVEFPTGEDPDSYARKLGTDQFRRFLQDSIIDFISYKTKLFLKESAGDPIAKANTIKEIVRSISRIPEALQRAVYIKQCSNLLEVDESLLIGELNKLQLKSNGPELPLPREEDLLLEKKDARALPDTIVQQEKESIRLLLNYGDHQMDDGLTLLQYFFNELDDVEFSNNIFYEILELVKSEIQSHGKMDLRRMLDTVSGEARKEMINLLSERYEISNLWMDKFQIYVPTEKDILSNVAHSNLLRLKYRLIKNLISQNREELREANAEEQHKLLQVDCELKKSRNELAKQLGIIVSD